MEAPPKPFDEGRTQVHSGTWPSPCPGDTDEAEGTSAREPVPGLTLIWQGRLMCS